MVQPTSQAAIACTKGMIGRIEIYRCFPYLLQLFLRRHRQHLKIDWIWQRERKGGIKRDPPPKFPNTAPGQIVIAPIYVGKRVKETGRKRQRNGLTEGGYLFPELTIQEYRKWLKIKILIKKKMDDIVNRSNLYI